MLIIKNIFQLFFAIILLSCTTTNQANDHKDLLDHQDSPKLELRMEQGREEGFMMFKLINQDTKDILTTPVGSNNNRVILISGDGNIVEHYSMVDIIPTTVKPGETKTWKVNMRPMLEHYKLQNDKNVQLIWNVNGVKSAPFYLNRRN